MIELKIARLLDKNPNYLLNLKQFRAILLDLTFNDIVYTNLIVSSLIDGIQYPISKLKKENEREITNIINGYMSRQSIDPKKFNDLLLFYLNVIAERTIPEKEYKVLDFDPIINLKTTPSIHKLPPKVLENYIPCGATKQDYGFYVLGLGKKETCTNEFSSVYATVFSILQRSLCVEKSIVIKEYESSISKILNLGNIFRLECLILLLIKTNRILSNKVNILYDGDNKELIAAIKNINYLSNIICELSNQKYEDLVLVQEGSPIKISLNEKDGDIKIKNAIDRPTNTRFMWHEVNIKYSINKDNEKYLYILLKEIFGFNEFLEGQKEALIQILNHPGDSNIIVLPMGGGKSLIYYFVALLQSGPTFIISPTDLLINDQIRNLSLFHNIDDVNELTFDMDFKEFIPSNKMLFLNPRTCLNRALICSLIKMNFHCNFSNVILDEVHCISNWGHDFRPDYLMLSFNLNEFFKQIGYQCFTATANYTVIQDIKEQLNIPISNIYSLATLKNTDFKYTFHSLDSENEIAKYVANELNEGKDETNLGTKRTIVFTKTKEEGKKVFDSLTEDTKLDVDIYNGHPSSYHDFVKGSVNAFIGGEGFGIGINMPRINNIIHYGCPISKSEYAQEIGRAARNKQTSFSSIYYLEKKAYPPIDSTLVDRSVTIEELLALDSSIFSEETKACLLKITGKIEEKEVYLSKTLSLKSAIENMNKNGRVSFKINDDKKLRDELDNITRCLFLLNRVGFIYGWYFENIDEINNLVTFYIDRNRENCSLDSMIIKTTSYLQSMGSHKKAISAVKRCKNAESIIREYVDWYYSQLLYYHREQYIEMLDFLDTFKNKTDAQVSNELDEYFSLSILNVYKDSKNTKKLKMNQLFDFALSNPNVSIVNNIRMALENEYDAKLDLFLYLYNIKEYGDIDYTRFARILINLQDAEKKELVKNLGPIYTKLSVEDKLRFVDTLCKHYPVEQVLTFIHEKAEKDIVYLYVLSKLSNDLLEG